MLKYVRLKTLTKIHKVLFYISSIKQNVTLEITSPAGLDFIKLF